MRKIQKLVTLNFLGVQIKARFKAGKYDYSAKIPLEVARECYFAAMEWLSSDSLEDGFSVQIGSGLSGSGKSYTASLFRYVKNGQKEDVQCILNLKFSDSGTGEMFVSYTTFGLIVEKDENSDAGNKEITLWSK
jgi:hypothetical protein